MLFIIPQVVINSFTIVRSSHRCAGKSIHIPLRFSASLRQSIDWVKQEPLESIIPEEDAHAIISELLGNEQLINDSEQLILKNLDSIEEKLRKETKSIGELLGEGTTNKILRSVEKVEGYDSRSVKAFLESDAINALFAKILYDGIFEFFQKIDFLGNIISSLPILGPIRKQIIKETRRSIDKSLGPLVQNFLGTYTKIAVLQASDFILSPSNRKVFTSANVKLVSNILDRPLNSLVPSSEVNEKLKKDTLLYLRNADMESVEKYLTYLYKWTGDKCANDFVDVDMLLEVSPTLQRTLENIDERIRGANDV